MKLGERIALLRKDPNTSRVGLKWTVKEYEQLLQEIGQTMPIEQIAQRHQRLQSSIIYHLYVLATFLIVNGSSLNETSEIVGIEKEKLAAFCSNTVTCEEKQYYITNASQELTNFEFSVVKYKS